MVVGTVSLVQKGQTSQCSGCSMQWNSGIWWRGHCVWCKKVKPVDAVFCGHSQTSGCSGCSMQYAVRSGIVVYGSGDIVFGTKRSNQWM